MITSGAQNDCKSLYIGNLAPKVTQTLLAELFSGVGMVMIAKVITDKITQESLGYGFVDFTDHQTAERAMAMFNGRELYGQDLRINWAVAGNKEDTSQHHHIFVGDLSPEVEDQALWEAFAAFGSLSDARVMRDTAGQRSRGYGFVAFREHEDAQQAIRMMTGVWLGSRPIRCNWANQKNSGGTGKTGGSKSGDYESVLYQTPKTNTTIYVGNIAPDTSERQLRDVFEEFGEIEEVRIQGDKGYAFVRFKEHQLAANAIINGSGKIIGMRTIRCSWGKEKTDAEKQQSQQQQQQRNMGMNMMQYGYNQMGYGYGMMPMMGMQPMMGMMMPQQQYQQQQYYQQQAYGQQQAYPQQQYYQQGYGQQAYPNQQIPQVATTGEDGQQQATTEAQATNETTGTTGTEQQTQEQVESGYPSFNYSEQQQQEGEKTEQTQEQTEEAKQTEEVPQLEYQQEQQQQDESIQAQGEDKAEEQ